MLARTRAYTHRCQLFAHIVMACLVLACIVMAYLAMAYTVMACMVMACIVMANVVMAYLAMAYTVMAYTVMAYLFMALVMYALMEHFQLVLRACLTAAQHIGPSRWDSQHDKPWVRCGARRGWGARSPAGAVKSPSILAPAINEARAPSNPADAPLRSSCKAAMALGVLRSSCSALVTSAQNIPGSDPIVESAHDSSTAVESFRAASVQSMGCR